MLLDLFFLLDEPPPTPGTASWLRTVGYTLFVDDDFPLAVVS